MKGEIYMYQQLSFLGEAEKSERKERRKNFFKERIKERMSKYGVETITECEILSVLTDIPSEKLEKYLSCYGIIDLAKNMDALEITKTQKRKLSLIFEVSRKLGAATVKDRERLDSSVKSGEYFKRLLSTKPLEEMTVAFLNSQNCIINTITTSKGTINETSVYIREIVKLAILNNAHAVILAHNHPGGSTTPSNADIHATKNIKKALELVQVNLLDHVIVCGEIAISLAEKGLL